MGMGIVKTFNNKEDIFNLAINLLQTTQDLVIKASPSLVVLDGEIGEFKTTEEIVAGQRKIVNSNDEIEYVPIFKEAGTILKVRPIVYNDETIQLNLNLEVSDFKLKKSVQSGVYIENGGTYNEEGGSKTSRSINTVIRVKNGETIFIGGLKKTSVKNEISKVPVLGDIPVVKTFFRNEVVRNEKTELFVKIKAEIEGSYNPQIESNKYETRERTRIYPRIEF
jgi:general secretion pathway protein D